MLRLFKRVYNEELEKKTTNNTFFFLGHEFMFGYAKDLIRRLEIRFE